MERFYNELLCKLEMSIKELEFEVDCPIQFVEATIHLIVNCLSEVRDYILKCGFKNVDEEIRFFKHQKPIIVSKLIYNNVIYKIETKNPHFKTCTFTSDRHSKIRCTTASIRCKEQSASISISPISVSNL